MKIYVLAPYQKEIIEALEIFSNVQNEEIELIGDSKKMNCMFIEKNEKFKIINIKNEEKIIDYLLEKNDLDSIVIFGDITEYSIKRLFKQNYDCEFGSINVISFAGQDTYHYVGTFSDKKRYYYEDKKKSIINTFKFMKGLGIKKANVGLVKSQKTKADEIETNVLRMLESDFKYKGLQVLDSIYVSEIFDNKLNLNMLIFDNYDITKIFIDAIKAVTYTKVATISYYNDSANNGYNNYFIMASMNRSKQEILFSFLMLYNIRKYSNGKKIASA